MHLYSTDKGSYDLDDVRGQYEYISEILVNNGEGSQVLSCLEKLYVAATTAEGSATEGQLNRTHISGMRMGRDKVADFILEEACVCFKNDDTEEAQRLKELSNTIRSMRMPKEEVKI